MAIRPILSSLARHRIAAGLIVAEVALALAFVSNALHMIAERVERLNVRTGLAESELINLDLRAIAPIEEHEALTQEDLRRLRALPGVKGVAVVNQVAFGDNNNNSGVNNKPDNAGTRAGAASYEGDEHFLGVHGLKLIAGRNFLPEEVLNNSAFDKAPETQVPALIISKELADTMFPGQSAVGKPLWVFNGSSTVVGVVEALTNTNPSFARTRHALIAPLRHSYRSGTYVLRVEPALRQQLIRQATAVIREVDPRRSVRRGKTLEEMRSSYFAEDRSMTWLLAGVSVALLTVTAFGIVGLASFWVAQRTRMIGVRRALGATQAQIRQYFQLENLLLCGGGVLLGMLGAVALSHFVMQPQGTPALPWLYLPIGALLLLLLGQLAVLAPARKAASLPAAAAMRA
ncbi:MAG: ABC transporter permease [Burkholderiales bacterium]|nr:ABC transporter permease [Burkholderiales bacterium]